MGLGQHAAEVNLNSSIGFQDLGKNVESRLTSDKATREVLCKGCQSGKIKEPFGDSKLFETASAGYQKEENVNQNETVKRIWEYAR